jgi:hypothetical protein
MRRKLASLCLAAGLVTGVFAFTAQSTVASFCRGPGDHDSAVGPYYGGDPTTYGYIGVATNNDDGYVEVNGGLASSPAVQVESKQGYYGRYINSDGDYGEC